MKDRFIAVYRISAKGGDAAARAEAIAVEQSVEMPPSAIRADHAARNTIGRIEHLARQDDGSTLAHISLTVDSVAADAGQLMNMLFGNSSLHDDLELVDIELPTDMASSFGGPRLGIPGMRASVAAQGRALTCSAIKPLGSSASQLAELAYRLALGGIDYVKDDHGLAQQCSAPLSERLPACARAIARANRQTGGSSRYAPSLTGNLDQLRTGMRLARDEGVDTVLLAPMIIGPSNMQALRRDDPNMALIAHPAMAGAARISPPLLLGRLFRLMGADATIFPNHGGRFGYTQSTCETLADVARQPWHGLAACLPVPAGGMTVDRVPEMLELYGPDVMLLIGGGLLTAADALVEAACAFSRMVASHAYRA